MLSLVRTPRPPASLTPAGMMQETMFRKYCRDKSVLQEATQLEELAASQPHAPDRQKLLARAATLRIAAAELRRAIIDEGVFWNVLHPAPQGLTAQHFLALPLFLLNSREISTALRSWGGCERCVVPLVASTVPKPFIFLALNIMTQCTRKLTRSDP
jgi:hypothetical protein